MSCEGVEYRQLTKCYYVSFCGFCRQTEQQSIVMSMWVCLFVHLHISARSPVYWSLLSCFHLVNSDVKTACDCEYSKLRFLIRYLTWISPTLIKLDTCNLRFALHTLCGVTQPFVGDKGLSVFISEARSKGSAGRGGNMHLTLPHITYSLHCRQAVCFMSLWQVN